MAKRLPVYTDFEDELGDAVAIELKHAATGTDWARFREKAGAYLRAHDDNLALQRLRRNKQLTSNDLEELERMLRESGSGDSADLERARSGGLGLFVRQLVGLDRQAAIDAFARYLDEGLFSVDQVRFVKLIIDELTARGVIEPRRLFDQEPYTSGKTSGILAYFPEDDVEIIIGTVAEFTERTKPSGVA